MKELWFVRFKDGSRAGPFDLKYAFNYGIALVGEGNYRLVQLWVT